VAARAGVPDDRSPPERELAGVFRALEPVHAECRALRDAAEDDAHRTSARARRRAEILLADAQARAATERTSAVAESRARGDVERAAIIADAERQAGLIRERVAARMPEMVARAVELVRKELR
jgi:vacuolar-type H+-ATPase subunit H